LVVIIRETFKIKFDEKVFSGYVVYDYTVSDYVVYEDTEYDYLYYAFV
jgi:hypothetical protein